MIIAEGRRIAMILEYQARNVAEILAAVRKCSAKWAPRPQDPEELWFRGDKHRFGLLPGIYRKPSLELKYDEENLQERFKARGAPFVPGGGGTAWDWYFRAQHFGVPTRLLDWTESLIAATYFATAAHINFSDRRPFDRAREGRRVKAIFDSRSPAIWVLDAGSLNHFTFGDTFDYVFAIGGPGTDVYLPDAINQRHEKNRYPVAILAPYTNERISAQQGTFTIHGHENVPLDQLASTPEGRNIKLAAIVIDRSNVANLYRELEYLGVSQASLFPGLESLATVTKWFAQSSSDDLKRSNNVAKRKGGSKKKAKKPGK
jgi:hypothetical protein